MIRIHFPFFDSAKDLLPLPAACGLRAAGAPPASAPPRFEALYAAVPKLFQAVALEDAQLVYYPHCLSDSEDVKRTMELARVKQLPCVFVKHGDDAAPVEIPYGIVYRESLRASLRHTNERIIPAFVDDPLGGSRIADVVRPKRRRPSVGFCGYTGSAVAFPAYYFLRKEKLYGLQLRRKAVRTLRMSKECDTRFILRKQYWGGALALTERRIKSLAAMISRSNQPIPLRRNSTKEAEVYREFVTNMLETDYTLCVRGAGNYSYRFYEVLAAGRIPVFVNTDCELPFSDRIDWRRHCVWVEETGLDGIADAVLHFHQSKSPEEFEALQIANRQLYETYFTPSSFHRIALQELVGEAVTRT